MFLTDDVAMSPFFTQLIVRLPLLNKWAAISWKRRDPKTAFDNFNSWTKVMAGWKQDPFNTFDYIMDVSEQFGLTSNFLFMRDAASQHMTALMTSAISC